ncbi:hypothetical protein GGR56DRAFT_672709 [Xylariaceae sp. FL0804]|nr:hypothetical protein GGR56DRAFT_672709 [Xylariaceae sp. FL0804]
MASPSPNPSSTLSSSSFYSAAAAAAAATAAAAPTHDPPKSPLLDLPVELLQAVLAAAPDARALAGLVCSCRAAHACYAADERAIRLAVLRREVGAGLLPLAAARHIYEAGDYEGPGLVPEGSPSYRYMVALMGSYLLVREYDHRLTQFCAAYLLGGEGEEEEGGGVADQQQQQQQRQKVEDLMQRWCSLGPLVEKGLDDRTAAFRGAAAELTAFHAVVTDFADKYIADTFVNWRLEDGEFRDRCGPLSAAERGRVLKAVYLVELARIVVPWTETYQGWHHVAGPFWRCFSPWLELGAWAVRHYCNYRVRHRILPYLVEQITHIAP